MSIATKMKKAERLGVVFEDGFKPTSEEEIDKLIEAKQAIVDQQKDEDRIIKAQQKKADDEARKNVIILKDVDGDDVEQSEYFWPRLEKEKVGIPPNEKILEPTTETAPTYFNKSFGIPVDRDELIDVFVQYFPRKKGFLFYKLRDREVYIVIVPLKYAKTISRGNESRPGDFQKHALSFIAEGSVNIDSLKLKLQRIAGHSSISTEPLVK
jgi:hypothetical protein